MANKSDLICEESHMTVIQTKQVKPWAIGLVSIGIFVGFVIPLIITIYFADRFANSERDLWGLNLIILFGGFILIQLGALIWKTADAAQHSEELKSAQAAARAEPHKISLAWDLGWVKLQLYFDRNLAQINSIFWVSVVAMSMGFGVIIWGAINPVSVPDRAAGNPPAAGTAKNVTPETKISPDQTGKTGPNKPGLPDSIVIIAGIITEFIGATFLFLYKSTMQQAEAYTKTLERINSVGMAMAIMDTISDNSLDLKDKTRAELIHLLMSDKSTPVPPEPKAPASKAPVTPATQPKETANPP